MTRALVLIIVVVLALCACSQKPVAVAPPAVPPGLLTCKDAPAKPRGDYTQKDVGMFIVDLHAAHADCQSKLNAVRGALVRD